MEPTFVPEPLRVARAEAMLRKMLPAAELVSSSTTADIAFIDAGSNWDGVACSACGGDAESWWSDAVSEAFESRFRSLQVQATCCGQQVALDKLRYGWPVAFARFKLEVRNPGVPGLSFEQLEQLGTALQCELIEVKAHV